ncbi:MAG: NAD(P)H-dependent oxidoreductase [Lactobacillaceae bacterium]|jgi:FMN-dependent NADH-azoreductase|nr:NAD(P)H-dependent oxidoreductase [Lactobacillaceae bacterium]
MDIFHLECSVNDSEHSLTRKYSRMIVEKIKSKHTNVNISYVDLIKENIPFIDKAYETAMFKPESARTPEDEKILASFDLTSFVNADAYVLGIPGYFYNVPAIFKNWFEHLFRIDTTLTENWVGLLGGRKIYIVSAWGGEYLNTAIEHSFETIIRKSFDLFGLTDITFFNIYHDKITETDNIKAIERAINEII